MLATDQQRKMFFALGHQLNFEPDEIKKRAKLKFNLETFKDITSEQISELIDALMALVVRAQGQNPHREEVVPPEVKTNDLATTDRF